MSAEQRLTRLYPALSARERGLLVLQAYKAGQKPDPLIYSSTPSGQGREFNRLIRLMNAINTELTYAILVIGEQVKQIDLKYGWLMSIILWGNETEALGGCLLARTKDRRVRADVRKLMARAPGALELPLDLSLPSEPSHAGNGGVGASLVRALLLGIKSGLDQHWSELRCIEIAIKETMDEFGGEDPLHADAREILDAAKATCTNVKHGIAIYVEPFELGEPRDDEVEMVRMLIKRAMDA